MAARYRAVIYKFVRISYLYLLYLFNNNNNNNNNDNNNKVQSNLVPRSQSARGRSGHEIMEDHLSIANPTEASQSVYFMRPYCLNANIIANMNPQLLNIRKQSFVQLSHLLQHYE